MGLGSIISGFSLPDESRQRSWKLVKDRVLLSLRRYLRKRLIVLWYKINAYDEKEMKREGWSLLELNFLHFKMSQALDYIQFHNFLIYVIVNAKVKW